VCECVFKLLKAFSFCLLSKYQNKKDFRAREFLTKKKEKQQNLQRSAGLWKNVGGACWKCELKFLLFD
jgi:hypothetical protein